MTKLMGYLSSGQALIMGVVIVGCATAVTITGHMTPGDYVGILAGVGLVGGTVTTAHVVGSQVNSAAVNAVPAPAPAPAAQTGGTV